MTTHMKAKLALLAPVLAALLSACGNLQGLKVAEVPATLRSTPVTLSTQRPPQLVSPGAIEIPDHSVFLKQTAGGSAALGILFGPIGGLINGANIERLSQEMAQNSQGSSLLQIDALAEAAAAWGQQPVQADPKTLQLRPYVIVYPDEGRKTVTVISGTYVSSSHPLPEGKLWNADYHYVLPAPLGFDVLDKPMAPEKLVAFKNELKEGFRQIRAEIARDLAPEQPSRRVAMIWAEPLKSTLPGFAGFSYGDVETEPSGRLVLRGNMENWGGTVGAASREMPHQVWIFVNPAQYRFDAEPQERVANKQP
jgi:hypothetical protein